MDKLFNDFPSLELLRKHLNQVLSQGYQRVMVSCSGGLDSTVLFHMFWQIAKSQKNFSLALMHVNFGLRGAASDSDETFCRELSQQANVPFHLHRVKPDERAAMRGASVQEWARKIRREFSLRLAGPGSLIALAHHRDDLAENVIMRLARGVAPLALGGMRELDLPFWRPLLASSRQELQAFAEKNALLHRIDASNATLDYSRNVIRHRVIPELERLYPGASKRLAACAEDAHDMQAWFEATNSNASLTLAQLTNLPRGAARARLAGFIQAKVAARRQLSRDLLDQMLAAARQDEKFIFSLPGGGYMTLAGQEFVISVEGESPLHAYPALRLKPERQRQHEHARRGPKIEAWLPYGGEYREQSFTPMLSAGYAGREDVEI